MPLTLCPVLSCKLLPGIALGLLQEPSVWGPGSEAFWARGRNKCGLSVSE